MDRIALVLGGVFGLTGVAAGAFGVHALREAIPPDRLDVFKTGAQYQLVHAVVVLGLAWAVTRWPGGLTTAAVWLFAAGIVLFSGSLYLLAGTGVRGFGAITPVGGLCLLAGWACIVIAGVRGR